MDDREAQPSEMQTDGLDATGDTQRVGTLLPPASDENENRLISSQCETATTVAGEMDGEGMQQLVEQDSINNNESCNQIDGSQSHEELERPSAGESPSGEPKLRKEKRTSGKRSMRSKKGSSGESAGSPPAETAALVPGDIPAGPVQKITLEANANNQLKEPKQHLQSLFSVIREEFEQNDVVSLPHCLHQIAETYFQEEEYEKAMQFIQLERLYHEQLLANLSAIQEQWETKSKRRVPEKMSSRGSDNGLDSDELERLALLCTSHQEPAASKRKLIPPENIVEGGTTRSVGSEELSETVVDADKADRGAWPGVCPGGESQEGVVEGSARSPAESSADSLGEDSSLRAAPVQEHMEESYCGDESTLEEHTKSSGPVGRPRSGCLSSGDVRNDTSCLRLGGTQPREDVADRVETSEDCAEGLPLVDSVVTKAGLDSEPINGLLQAAETSLRLEHCDDGTEIDASQLGTNILGDHLPDLEGAGSGRCPQDRSDPSGMVCNDKPFGHAKASLPERVGRDSEEQVTHEATENQLNGDRKDTEESIGSLAGSSDASESLPDEEVSYSPGEAVLEDHSISLDELAKRIEVEEIAPAEGLVSILKKQSENEGKKLAQIQQKQAKRRVRFQEMDDALDQEDLGGGSCFVLILLCAATVFLSIGGTALYCTVGFVESPVCKDFADNMDFYYTRILQGIDELKHWFSSN